MKRFEKSSGFDKQSKPLTEISVGISTNSSLKLENIEANSNLTDKQVFECGYRLFANSNYEAHWQVARLLLYLKRYSTDIETLRNICDFVLQNHPNNEPIKPISWKQNKTK